MRKVHDVWRLSGRNSQAIAAFVQWGNDDEGRVYEVICPFCGKTTGWVDDRDENHTDLTLRVYFRKQMQEHIARCEFPVSTSREVEIVKHIPNVEHIPEMM